MPAAWRHAGRVPWAALAAFLLVARLAPSAAMAGGALVLGAPAVTVADVALLRAAPGYDAAAAGDLAPGTAVTPLAGPFTAADGSIWYQVAGGNYLPASAMAPAAASEAQTAPPDASPSSQATTEQDAPTAAPTDPAVPTEAPPAADEKTPDDKASNAKRKNNAKKSDATSKEDENAPTTPAPDATIPAATDPPATDPPATDPPATEAAAAEPTPTATAMPTASQATDGPAPTAPPSPIATPAPDAAPTEAPTASAGSSPDVIGTVWIVGSEGAACHAEMDIASPVLAVYPEGSQVDVIGQTIGDWQPVLCNGSPGYLRASSITWWKPAPATAVPAATPGTGTDASDAGKQVANYALQYVGYPYVDAAEGPNAFDCSGFTMYVIQHTLGLNITHDMFVQYDMGTKVDRSDLQPGDLVFFQNTFKPGLSHVGIYIGRDQFVNAENETTGVVVSDLDSDYYASRWYGAVRYSNP